MKLSGHNFSNAVFDSLLDNIQKDVVVLKKASKSETQPVNFNFTQTTAETYNGVVSDELKFIASELVFAAKAANVELTGDDLNKFASEAKTQGLRGKALERAARKYCSNLVREFSPPMGVTRIASADELIKASSVTPAGYPEEVIGNSKTGGFMGMSKNPNTIWDSDALQKLASKPEEHTSLYGDEQINISKKAKEDFKIAQKNQQWQTVQDQMSHPDMLRKSVASQNISTVEKSSFNPNIPSNAMSMFNDDRDFSKIPDKTAGETLKEAAMARADKSASAKSEWNKLAGSKKADNNANFLFNGNQPSYDETSKSQRSATDRLFDGLLSYIDKKPEK